MGGGRRAVGRQGARPHRARPRCGRPRHRAHRVIYDELCLGVVPTESPQAYQRVIDRLVGRGAGGVVLGCTEIELLVTDRDLEVPVFPTTRLHVEAAIDLALR